MTLSDSLLVSIVGSPLGIHLLGRSLLDLSGRDDRSDLLVGVLDRRMRIGWILNGVGKLGRRWLSVSY